MTTGIDQRAIAIYAPIQSRLNRVEERLRNLDDEAIPDLHTLLDYVLSSGGKRVRPAITLLASDFYAHDDEKPIIMSAAIELLHLATLVHDDTVDNSDLRRGKATVSHQWGKHIAVLFGDYVFAASATFVCDTENVRVIRRFSKTIMELASGEIIEYFNCYNPQQAREMYQDRIYRKTASLFRTAAETGAILGNAPELQVQALTDYGYNMGMAFQMVDDLLDVQGDPSELGKPVGNDLLQGVLTLPSIMLLERYPDNNPIEALFRERSHDGLLQQALDMINNSSIISDCYTEIHGYCAKAAQALEILPDCDARRSLRNMTDYIWERTR
ncbi:MAG: polyprenyl synthetase family protein [Chloroflexi bacterium]|nr:polyprenyl synthetase family protein [Chloroflexota bacterium]MDA1218934.1 polyprenyl synthetase family protein [Chloroflexota bacterium]